MPASHVEIPLDMHLSVEVGIIASMSLRASQVYLMQANIQGTVSASCVKKYLTSSCLEW